MRNLGLHCLYISFNHTTNGRSILRLHVRNALLILLALTGLAAPAALAGGSAKGDGTLSVRDGNGRVTLTGRVSAFGRVESGRITFTSLDPFDATEPDLFDTCERVKLLADGSTLCSGAKLRFRLLGARYKIVIVGRGIDLSVVGKAQTTLEGADTTLDDGDYSLNGALYKALPQEPLTLAFGQAATPTAP